MDMNDINYIPEVNINPITGTTICYFYVLILIH